MKNTLYAVIMAFVLASCGGGSESTSSAPSSTGAETQDATPSSSNNTNTTNNDAPASSSESLAKKVAIKPITVDGTLPANHFNFSNWKGTIPNIIYRANADSSVDIAWVNTSNGTIKITKVDTSGNLVNEFTLNGLPKLTSLMGFTRSPDGSIFVAYGTTEAYTFEEGNEALVPAGTVRDIGHYYLARFDSAGKKVWNKHIYGNNHAKAWGDPFNPGSSSSARLEYDPRTNSIVYFVGINRRTGRLQIHQASAFGVYSLNGDYLSSEDWYISHNFDQRILFDGDKTYFFGHGDSGPYGLFVGMWKFTDTGLNDFGKPTMKREAIYRGGAYAKYFTNSRINQTNHAMGDVIGLGNGEFIAVYGRGKERDWYPNRGNYNVFFRRLDTKGADKNERHANIQDFAKNKQLTTTPTDKYEHNGVARVAKYGDNVIVAWHNSTKPYAYIGEYDIDGNVVVAPKMIDKATLNGMYGMITLPNGNVFWASSEKKSGNKLNLHWIKK